MKQTVDAVTTADESSARPVRIGSMFTGMGGLDLAVRQVFGGQTMWVADIEPGPSKVLDCRFPGIPNLGDLTTVDWALVPPVDILCGSSPCTSLSQAGRRVGMVEGTPSNLWVCMRDAIAQIQPELLIWENVYGALSAKASSSVEPCAGCVGNHPAESSLRALGRVLGDLATLGFDAVWTTVRAAEVGAPHRRARVFLVAVNTRHGARRPEHGQQQNWRPGRFGQPDTCPGGRSDGAGDAGGPAGREDGAADLMLLPTPRVSSGTGPCLHGDGGHDLQTAISLLPIPCANLGAHGSQTPARRKDHALGLHDVIETMAKPIPVLLPTPCANLGAHGSQTPARRKDHALGLHDVIETMAKPIPVLLPTPRAFDAQGSLTAPAARRHVADGFGNLPEVIGASLPAGCDTSQFGQYQPAVDRWAEILGRPAPPPTVTSRNGNPRLNPAFCEWMMGLPDGWVTGVPGVSRAQALRMVGNGVVPQQAAAALHHLADILRETNRATGQVLAGPCGGGRNPDWGHDDVDR